MTFAQSSNNSFPQIVLQFSIREIFKSYAFAHTHIIAV